MDKLKFAYRHLPVEGRYGRGSYTYTFIMETNKEVFRYEVFANNPTEAVNYLGVGFGFRVINTVAIDSTTWQLAVYGAVANCYLYID